MAETTEKRREHELRARAAKSMQAKPKAYILCAGQLAEVLLDSGAEGTNATRTKPTSYMPSVIAKSLEGKEGFRWTSKTPTEIHGYDGTATQSLGSVEVQVVVHTAYAKVYYGNVEMQVYPSKDKTVLLSDAHLERFGFTNPQKQYLEVQRAMVGASKNDALSLAIREETGMKPEDKAREEIRRIRRARANSIGMVQHVLMPDLDRYALRHVVRETRKDNDNDNDNDNDSDEKSDEDRELAEPKEIGEPTGQIPRPNADLIDATGSFTEQGWRLVEHVPLMLLEASKRNYVTTAYLQRLKDPPERKQVIPKPIGNMGTRVHEILGAKPETMSLESVQGELRIFHGGKGGKMTVLSDATLHVIESTVLALAIGAEDASRMNDINTKHVMDGTPGDIEREELDMAIDLILDRAEKECGLKRCHTRRMRKLIQVRYHDLFRMRLGTDPPARLPPLELNLIDGAEPPGKHGHRHYGMEQKQAMIKQLEALLAMGIVRYSETPWTSPIIMIRKPKGGWRLAFDARFLNKWTKKTTWTAPRIPEMLQLLQGATVFCSFDFLKGYWQLALAENSRQYMGLDTPLGNLEFTRAPMGAKNTGAHFQMCIQRVFSDMIGKGMLNLSDDVLLYAKSTEEMFGLLENFLERCERYGLKFNPSKVELFVKETTWCGQKISPAGIEVAPHRIDALNEMSTPETVADLLTFWHAANYSSDKIPKFAAIASPMKQWITERMSKCKRKTKQAASKIKLTAEEWAEVMPKYEAVRTALRESIVLAHYDPDKRICVWTDASTTAWAGVITQCDEETLKLPLEEQTGKHQLLGCNGGVFTNSQVRWMIPDKEAYAIVATLPRFKHFLYGKKPFRLYTDHKNITYIFDPLRMMPEVNLMYRSRLNTWALQMLDYEYEIQHVDGELNYFADLLSRWAQKNRPGQVKPPDDAAIRRCVRVVRVEYDPNDIAETPVHKCKKCQRKHAKHTKHRRRGAKETNASNALRLPIGGAWTCWPHLDEIVESQRVISNKEIRENGYDTDEDGTLYKDDAIVVGNIRQLHARLISTAHQGMAGHRAGNATYQALEGKVYWPKMKKDVTATLEACLQCRKNIRGDYIPRPAGRQIIAEAPNEVLSIDFLDIDGMHVAIAVDNFSKLKEIVVGDATAEVAARLVINWCMRNGIPKVLISDQGPHFRNELLKIVANTLRIEHSMTTAYAPWSNGAIERVNGEFLKVLQALADETNTNNEDWHELLPMVWGALNMTSVPSLGNRSPIEVHTGRKPIMPVDMVVLKGKGMKEISRRAKTVTISDVSKYCHALSKELSSVYKEVAEIADKRRQSSKRTHDKHARKAEFELGDIILAYRRTEAKSKVMARAEGPFTITDTARNGTYMVQRLDKKGAVQMHPARMVRYADCHYDITKELVDSASEGANHTVDKFVAYRHYPQGSGIEIQVKWIGFPDMEDMTWQDAAELYAQVPGLVKNLLLPKAREDALVAQVMRDLTGVDSSALPDAISMRKEDILKELKKIAPATARGQQLRSKRFLADLLELERSKLESNTDIRTVKQVRAKRKKGVTWGQITIIPEPRLLRYARID